MPVFGPDTFTDQQVNAIARYVEYLHDPTTRAGCRSACIGPVPEGFVACCSVWAPCCSSAVGSSARMATAPRRRDERPPAGEQCRRRQWRQPLALVFGDQRAGVARARGPVRAGRPAAGRGRAARGALGGVGFGFVTWAQATCSRRTGDVETASRWRRATRTSRPSSTDRLSRAASISSAPAVPAAGCSALAAGAWARGAVPDPLARPEPGQSLFRTAWRQGKRLVDEQGEPIRIDDLNLDGVVTVFPEGHVDDGRLADAAHPPVAPDSCPARARDLDARGIRRLLEAVHPRRLPGRPVPGQSSSCCARATSRRSTCSTAPSRCSAPPRARCRSCRSGSTTTASCAEDDFTEPVGPGFWDRDTLMRQRADRRDRGSTSGSARPSFAAHRARTRCSPTTGRSCSASSRSTASSS